jgi:iron transport multicopper oxidase
VRTDLTLVAFLGSVIEADGVNTEPLVVDSIQIYAAQRYSLIMHANQPVNNYWIRALPNQGNITTDGGLNSGTLMDIFYLMSN